MTGDYEEFFAGTIGPLSRYAARWVGDAGEGENIAGEVMVLVYSRWDELGRLPAPAVKAFAYRAAAFRSRNHLRLGARSDMSLDPAMYDAGPRGSGMDPMAGVELRADIARVMEGMGEGLAEVVRFRLFAGLPFSEIGEILGIPEGTARRRFHDGALRMRVELDQYVTEGR